MPKDFPPKSTVWRYYKLWCDGGTLDALQDRLRTKVRAREKPYAPHHRPWGQSVGGRDLLLAVPVTAADVDDATAAQRLFPRLEGQPMGKVTRMVADSKYRNRAPYQWVEDHARWDLVIVRRPDGAKGWVKLPIRWTVGRTFAWLGTCRRLTRDRQKTVRSSEAFVQWAMIHLMPNRLEPKHADAEFQYHTAA